MILILLLLAIIIGYLRKGRLGNLSGLSIRMVPLLILAFLLQGAIYLGYAYDVTVIQDFDILIHFVSYILLFAALMSNFENKWFVVMTLGMILNFLVIFLNGGRMPVSTEALEAIGMSGSMEALFAKRAGTHQPLVDGMFLWFLADVIPIRFPDAARILSNIYSLGDFIIYAGAMGMVQSAMVPHKHQNSELDLDELLDEELMGKPAGESLFQDDVNEEEIARLRELRKKREQETRRIFQDETADYFEQGETVILPKIPPADPSEAPVLPVDDVHTPVHSSVAEVHYAEDEKDSQTEPSFIPLVPIEEEPTVVEETTMDEEVPEKESEPEWKIDTQDFANAALLGGSPLEEQILKGENYTEEDLFQQRKYYTRPLHERMRIDLESDGYEWKSRLEKDSETEDVSAQVTQEEPVVEEVAAETPPQPVDTTHPFIIVDGRIVENPNYYRAGTTRKPGVQTVPIPAADPVDLQPEERDLADEEATDDSAEVTKPAEVRTETVVQDVPVAMATEQNTWIPVEEPQENLEEDPSTNILLKLKDEERIDLMKKMKERKERGYSLVQVKVGDKTITFWKKDL